MDGLPQSAHLPSAWGGVTVFGVNRLLITLASSVISYSAGSGVGPMRVLVTQCLIRLPHAGQGASKVTLFAMLSPLRLRLVAAARREHDVPAKHADLAEKL